MSHQDLIALTLAMLAAGIGLLVVDYIWRNRT